MWKCLQSTDIVHNFVTLDFEVRRNMKLPDNSLLYRENFHWDYMDTFQFLIKDSADKISLDEVVDAMSKPGPKWFQGLFAIRNKIASLFNLKTSATEEEENTPHNKKWEVGSRAGIFKIYAREGNEIILGENDSHLDFRVSVVLEYCDDPADSKLITMSTAVKYNNRLGRAYFFVVKPFHRLLVPVVMRKNFKRLKSEINHK